MKPRHKLQGEKLHALGLSYNTVAKDLKMPRSTNNFYFSQGRIAPKHARYPDRIDAYIKMKSAELKRGKAVHGANLRGYFVGLGVTMDYVATETGVKRADVMRGVWSGIWPDEATRQCVTDWIKAAKEQAEGKIMINKIGLSDDVQGYWGLKRDPFTNEMEDVDDIFDTKELARAEKKILIAVDGNGWVAITGPRGSGKTTLMKRVKIRLAKRKEVVLIEPRTLEKEQLRVSHVCDSILRDVGAGVPKGRCTLEQRARLVGEALEQAYEDRQKVVILIDEAHLLRDDMLLGLKRIYEFEKGFQKLLSIVLIGQTPLARTLKKEVSLAEVGLRVDLYELGALNGAMGDYLEHKLARAGLNGNKEVFDKSALKAMRELSDTPLALNNLAAAAMIAAHDLGEKVVTGEIVKSI